jgi:hypothetical protein
VTGLSVTASKTLTVSNSLTLSGTDSSSIAFGGGGTVAYTDKANTFGAFAQNFAAATSLTIPTSAGAAPTASGTIAYDSTSNTWEAGVNGGNKTFLFTDGNGSSLTALNGSAVASGTVGLTVGGTGVTSWASNQALVMGLGLIGGLALFALPAIGVLLTWLTWPILEWILRVTHYFASLAFVARDVHWPLGVGLAVTAGLILCVELGFWQYWQTQKRLEQE